MTGEGEEARADIDIEGNVGVWRGVEESGWVGCLQQLGLLSLYWHDITLGRGGGRRRRRRRGEVCRAAVGESGG